MTNLEKIVLAHRYLYYVLNSPVISDEEYDRLEQQVLPTVSKDSMLHLTCSECEEDYPNEVINYAFQMLKD
jgi:NAD-dependent DNA ligase